MFEHYQRPLISRQEFYRRQVRFAAFAVILVLGALLIGILGYRITEGMGWIDAILNASMILGGMGPVDSLHTVAGKLFASFYALFAGMIFLVSVGVLIAPIFHRFLHQFHVQVPDDDDDDDDKPEAVRSQRPSS